MTDTTPEFQTLVLSEIRRQSRCGARWPTPVSIIYSGKSTEEAARLGCETSDDVYRTELERRVHAAVKRLHEQGKVLFVWRYGYTWIIEPIQVHTPDEIVEGPQPVNTPTGWDRL